MARHATMNRIAALSTALTLFGSLASAAYAQAPVEFVIDTNATQFTYSGTTTLGPIVGNPSSFSFVGNTFATMTGSAGAPPQTIQLGGGGSALITPDINASVPSPIPIFPALAQIQITNLALRLQSVPVPIDAAGNFNAQIQAELLSGVVTVSPLTGAPTTMDLTGVQSAPQAFPGNLAVLGDITTLSGQLTIPFTFVDPGTNISATINLTGNVVAEATAAQPFQYCQSTVNTTGSAATMTHTGSPSLTAANLTLVANDVPVNQFLLFILSDTADFSPGFAGSQGNLCVGGSIVRLNNFLQNSGAQGQATLPIPYGSLPQGTVLDIGETWHFQAWFRDTVGGVPTSNTTSGLQVTFAP